MREILGMNLSAKFISCSKIVVSEEVFDDLAVTDMIWSNIEQMLLRNVSSMVMSCVPAVEIELKLNAVEGFKLFGGLLKVGYKNGYLTVANGNTDIKFDDRLCTACIPVLEKHFGKRVVPLDGRLVEVVGSASPEGIALSEIGETVWFMKGSLVPVPREDESSKDYVCKVAVFRAGVSVRFKYKESAFKDVCEDKEVLCRALAEEMWGSAYCVSTDNKIVEHYIIKDDVTHSNDSCCVVDKDDCGWFTMEILSDGTVVCSPVGSVENYTVAEVKLRGSYDVVCTIVCDEDRIDGDIHDFVLAVVNAYLGACYAVKDGKYSSVYAIEYSKLVDNEGIKRTGMAVTVYNRDMHIVSLDGFSV